MMVSVQGKGFIKFIKHTQSLDLCSSIPQKCPISSGQIFPLTYTQDIPAISLLRVSLHAIII